MPPPRRRRVHPLVPFAVLGAVTVAAVGGIYYVTDYQPREYLKDWAARTSPPAGRFTRGYEVGDNKERTFSFAEQCYTTNPCDPPPIDAITAWIPANGGYADKSKVSQCFQFGGYITLSMAKHSSSMQCQQVVPGGPQEVKFTVRLQY